VIVSLDGKPVDSVEAFFGALRGHHPGDRVTVEVIRDGRKESLQITLAERPPD
jgi:S1-C subfamily serine protease